jgi:murein DD-endopeptidase MepM/ murein hydrolase activator NlpD
MPNPYKITALVVIACTSLGAMAVMQPHVPPADPETAPTIAALYAAPVENVETHVLGRGETLSTVLAQARITGQEMADLLLGLRKHYNPRRLSDKAEITVRRWASTNEPRVVEVRVNRDSTIRLVKNGIGWNSEVVVTPTVTDTVFAGGVIGAGRSTLYEAIVFDEESQLPPAERVSLVYDLATIYEFKLDFSREIQQGDSYRVVYEREARPDGTARSKKILAAEIVTQGVRVPAIWFEGSSDVRGYFDDQARPLAHGFSKYPIAFPRITSRFNPNRYHPVLRVNRAHAGTDFGAPSGSDVQSVANGTVTFAGTSGGYGKMVEIRHFNGYTTRYAHLRGYGPGIRVGTRVTQKQVIGYVGATGLATAPHLHYELRKNGRAVDAMKERLPAAPPIPGGLKTRFMAVAEVGASLLARIPSGTFYADTRSTQSGTTRAVGAL